MWLLYLLGLLWLFMVLGALQGSKTKVILPQADWLYYFRSCCVYGITHSNRIPISPAFLQCLIWCYVCKAWEGVGVVASARKLIGATYPLQAEPGTIRGDLAVQTGR